MDSTPSPVPDTTFTGFDIPSDADPAQVQVGLAQGYAHTIKSKQRMFSVLKKIDVSGAKNPFLSEKAVSVNRSQYGCIDLPQCNFAAASAKTAQVGVKTMYGALLAACKGQALSCRQFVGHDTLGGRLQSGKHLPLKHQWQYYNFSGVADAEHRSPAMITYRTTFVSPVASNVGTANLLRDLNKDISSEQFSRTLHALLAHFVYMQFVMTFGDSPGVVLMFTRMQDHDTVIGGGKLPFTFSDTVEAESEKKGEKQA